VGLLAAAARVRREKREAHQEPGFRGEREKESKTRQYGVLVRRGRTLFRIPLLFPSSDNETTTFAFPSDSLAQPVKPLADLAASTITALYPHLPS
jgi:hypothetical protein